MFSNPIKDSLPQIQDHTISKNIDRNAQVINQKIKDTKNPGKHTTLKIIVLITLSCINFGNYFIQDNI